MEMKYLQSFILLLLFIGMLLGVGVLTLDKFQRAVRTETTVISTGQNLSVTGTSDFSEEYCLDVTSVANSTTTYVLADYNVTFSNADDCIVSYSGFGSDCSLGLCNITYTYGADTASATSGVNTIAAITPIASTWLSLIVTVFVLAIILELVIRSFSGKSR